MTALPGSRSAYCTVSAITGQDYVEARMKSNEDPPHCEGDPVYSPVITYARTTLATNRATLTTANLNGATLTVTLGSRATTLTSTAYATFRSGVGASGFELVTTPSIPGLSFTVGAVTAGSRTATLTLATGSSYVNPPTSVAVRVKAAAHSGSTALTSKALPVQASPGLRAGPVSGLVTEGGGQATFPVRLGVQPTAAVTVSVSSLDTGEGTVEPSSLVFTTDNWSTAQTVTVTGVDDTLNDGPVTWQVRLDPSSGDTGYNGLANVDVDVTTFDDEPLSVSSTRWVTDNQVSFFFQEFDVTTTRLLGAAVGQSVGLVFDASDAFPTFHLQGRNWHPFELSACEWWAVTPGAVGTTGTCHTLKSANSGPTEQRRSITVDVTPTPTMFAIRGVVIRMRSGNLGTVMTEWVPLVAPALALSPASVSEGGGVSTVTATLSDTLGEAVTLTVAAAAVPPAVAADFTLSSTTTLTIAAGATTSTGTVTVTAVDNTVDAPDKTVTVSATVGGTVVSAVTLALPDDEALPKAALVLTPPSVTENGGISTVTATLSHPSSEAVTVTVTAAAVPPAMAGDFTQAGTTLTIAPGVTTSAGLVTVTAVDNAVTAADKQVVVTATAAGGRGVAAPPGVGLTLRDDELGLTEGAVSGQATEAGGQATFTVALLTQPTAAVTVAVSSRDESEGTVAPSSLVFSTGDWSTAQTVTVTGVQDPVDDGDVTWNVRLDPASGDTGYDGLSDVDVPVTTTDDDGPPGVALALDPASIAESGAGNVATVTARLAHPSGAATTVAVAAVAGVFTVGAGAAGVVVIAAGDTTSTDTATVTAVDDDTDAPDRTETVTATVTNDRATTDGTTMAVTGAALTVRDDDAAPTAALVLAPASVSESGGVSTVTATLSRPSSEPSTVTVAAVAGAYTVGADATIILAAGATTAASDTVVVTAVDDAIHQGGVNRSATVTAALANGQGAGTVSGATLTLTDDETLPVAGLALAPASISENGGIATVTATLSGPSSVAATVTVSTAAVSPAVAGDFTQTGTLLTIAAGATVSTGLVTVTAVDNPVDAANRTVTVSGTASGGHGVAAPSDATLTLADDEATATAALVLMPASISENGEVSTVTATLSHPTTEATTLTVAAAAVSPAVAGDFTLSTTTTLTLAAGATTSTGLVTVTANNNNDATGSKQVTVSATASGGRGVANPANATLALRDDDYGLVESAVSGQATEAGGTATFTVRLRSLPTAAVTVAVTSRDADGNPDESEGTVVPSSLVFLTTNWNAAQTVTVTGADDDVDDGTVTWTVRLAPSSGDTSYGALAAVDVPVTTTDDDTATATLVLTPPSILENGEVSTVTATLSHATTEAVTLTVAATAGTGAAATDFTLSTTTTLTLATGATTSTGLVTVTANDNTVASADKSVTVSATAAGGRGMANPSDATLTLRDDEATADVNGDGAVNANDGLLMYYAYTFEAVFKLENDLGRRVRGFLRTLRGAGSPAADDAGYKAMLQAAWDWRSAGATAGDVNGDGSIGANDGLLMYYAYTFEAVFKLENDLGRRVRGFLRTLRGAGSPAADDAGYKAMLDAAWGLR